MTDFELSYEFEPGIFVGTVLVEHAGKRQWIVPPELPSDDAWELPTDGFVDMLFTSDGTPMVDRFSRSASNMELPLPCWTKGHVESFVRRKLLR